MNILIAEPMSPAGIELFKSQPGWNVIVSGPKEYGQHLAEADGVAAHPGQLLAAGLVAQLQPLLAGLDGHQRQGGIQQLARVQLLDLQRHAPGLDAPDVQDVVHQAH